MDIKELKAQAYDCIAHVEFYQKRLQEVNALINKAVAEAQAEVKPEDKDISKEA